MATLAPSFLEPYADFVLKLKIDSSDGKTQLRRIRLGRIVNDEGAVSYDELVGLAVTFVFPKGCEVSDFRVSLTYVDDERDLITIGSSWELKDAIEQFMDQRVLRLTAEVSKKRASAGLHAINPIQRPSHAHREAPLHTILGSFVDVLASAVLTLQEGLAAPKIPSKQHGASMSGQAQSQPHDSIIAPIPEGTRGSNGPVAAERSASDIEPVVSETRASNREMTVPSAACGRQASQSSFEVKPFIHGRHTCDSCLKTPIVGKRYHAKNLPDYDLCSSCFDNYHGTEIMFETVELDRDRGFQERWHRRRERMSRTKAEQNAQGIPGSRPNVETSRAGTRGSPHNEPSSLQQHDTIGTSAHSDEFDDALKEAIRRSLLDVAHGGKGIAVSSNHSAESASLVSLQGNDETELIVAEASEDLPLEEVPEILVPAIDELKGVPDCEDEGSNKQDDDVLSSASMPVARTGGSPSNSEEVDSKEAQSHVKLSVADLGSTHLGLQGGWLYEQDGNSLSSRSRHEVVDRDFQGDDLGVKLAATKAGRISPLEQNGSKTSLSTDQDDCALSGENGLGGAATIESSCKSFDLDIEEGEFRLALPTKVERSSPLKQKDESFASDAKGSGDVAETIGHTLDLVADVITEMLTEAEGHNGVREKDATSVEDFSNDLILGSVTSPDVASVAASESDSWDLVSSASHGENQDAEIARAAEMLGSALFNSDMKSSAEAVSTLSSSESSVPGSFSAVSSVPSSIPSISECVASSGCSGR